MEQFFRESTIMKNIYITDTHIMASDEDYQTIEAFLEKVNSGKKGMLDTHIKLEYSDIAKIVIYRKEEHGENGGIQIFFRKDGKQDRTFLQFEQQPDFDKVLNHILSKRQDMKARHEEVKPKGVLFKPILYTIVVMAFSFALAFIAAEIEQGEGVNVPGRRKGLKMLFANIAEAPGFWGSLALGVVVTAGFIGYRLKKYKSSSSGAKRLEV